MRRFEFTEKQRQTIQYERYRHPDPNVQKRMEILALKMHGETHQRIAVLAGVSRRTVQRVLDLFWQGGLEKVRQFQWHIPTGALTGHAETLAEEFRRRPPHTVAEARRRIEELTGIRRGREQVRLFLKEHLGLSWRKTAAIPIPPKQTLPEHAARQADFLKQDLEPRLAEARAGKRSVFFVDAVHFVMGSFLGWVWSASRLFVRSAPGRQRFNVLGALNAVSLELVRVANDKYIKAETVCELLEKISALGLSTPVTLVMDNARYQRCKLVQNLASSLGIELLFLPSYSPNLNLIERLWKFVKKKALNSRRHNDFKEFQLSINDCLDRTATEYHDELKGLLNHKFQTFENVSMLTG